jgi:hypothetical protein
MLLIVCLNFSVQSKVKEISRVYLDTNEVLKVFVNPGKPLYMEFPCSITYALPGTKTDLEVVVGLEKKNNLTLWVHSMSDVTGVTLKCNEKVIPLDVIPSQKEHQRYIRVLGFRNTTSKNRELIASSDASRSKNKKSKRILIYSSEDQEKGGK